MSRELLVQLCVNVLVVGSLYTLVAVGLSLIFSIMGIINFAHAQMYVLGAFGLWLLTGDLGLNYGLAVVTATLLVGLFAFAIERLVVRPFQDDPVRAMTATLGLLLIINGGVLKAFGATDHYFSPPFEGTVSLFGGIVAVQKLLAVGVTFGVVGLMMIALRVTRVGRAMRAVAQDRDGAALQGINVSRINGLGFGIGSGLAALAGALILPVTAFVNPGVGDGILAKMFIIVILGGLGSIGGAVIGAFALAAIETIGYQYFDSLAILGSYLMVIALLLIRPTGIRGGQPV